MSYNQNLLSFTIEQGILDDQWPSFNIFPEVYDNKRAYPCKEQIFYLSTIIYF